MTYSGKQIFKSWNRVIKYLNILGNLYNNENGKIHRILAALTQLIFVHFLCIAQSFHVWKMMKSDQESFFNTAQVMFTFFMLCSMNVRVIWFYIKRDKILEVKQDIEDLLINHNLILGKNTISADSQLVKLMRSFMIFAYISVTALGAASFADFEKRSFVLSVWVPFDDIKNNIKFIISVSFATLFGYYGFLIQSNIDFAVLNCFGILRGIVLDFIESIHQTSDKMDLARAIKFTEDLRKIYCKIDGELSGVYLPQTIFGSIVICSIAYCCIYVRYLLYNSMFNIRNVKSNF